MLSPDWQNGVTDCALQMLITDLLQVENALTRARKEQIVAKLEKAFEGSAVVFGMHYKGLSVKKQEKLRHSLPPNSQMIICKNSLLRVAIDKQPQWKVTGDIAQVRMAAGLNSRAWPCMPHMRGVQPLVR